MTTHNAAPRLLTIKEAAAYTGLAVSTLYKMTGRRQIPYIKMGSLLKFDLAALDKWIKDQTVMPMPVR